MILKKGLCIFMMFLISLFTACSNQNIASSDSISSENVHSETSNTIQSDSNIATQDKIQGSDEVPSQLEAYIYTQAMEKWVALGGNYDFKNVESLEPLPW